jgi:hypothetical protein
VSERTSSKMVVGTMLIILRALMVLIALFLNPESIC